MSVSAPSISARSISPMPSPGTGRPELRFRSRRDILRTPHKHLRREAAALLTTLGDADWADEGATEVVIRELRTAGEGLTRRLAAVEAVLHPMLEQRVPGMTQEPQRRHGRLRARVKDLGVRAGQVDRAEGTGLRIAAGHRLYLAYAAFMAEMLDFLHEEEATTLSVLQQIFDDTELEDAAARMEQGHRAAMAAE